MVEVCAGLLGAMLFTPGMVHTALADPISERLPAVHPRIARSAVNGPVLSDLRVGNGSSPFAGDGALLTTISPNGDGFRDTAIVRFSVDRAARLTLLVYQARIGLGPLVGMRVVQVAPGPGSVVWAPPASTPPGSYILRLVLVDRSGRRSTYGWDEPYPTGYPRGPAVHVQGVDAATGQQGYGPGQLAAVHIATDAKQLTMVILHVGPETQPSLSRYDADHLYGVPVTQPRVISWAHDRSAVNSTYFRSGRTWPSGLYAVQLTSTDGRVGYAPFVLHAAGPSEPVLVVMPTNTWQAYNFRDANGDGWPDSWYADPYRHSVTLNRPYLHDGVPPNYREYLAGFIRWLYRTGHQPDFASDHSLADDSLATLRHYRLIVFPGHEEYVSGRAYDLITAYRNLGGNLAFLSADNFYRRVERTGQTLHLIGLWRDLGRPEASLIGVEYDGCCNGVFRPYTVTTTRGAMPWLLTGTGLGLGSQFGHFGIEADRITSSSPATVRQVAIIPNLMGPGLPAQMSYYATSRHARVFAAGVLNFAPAASGSTAVPTLLENLWTHLKGG